MKRELAVHMTASPEAVDALVTDVRRMGEWSPECLGGAWLDGAVGSAVGTRFTGTNKRARRSGPRPRP